MSDGLLYVLRQSDLQLVGYSRHVQPSGRGQKVEGGG